MTAGLEVGGAAYLLPVTLSSKLISELNEAGYEDIWQLRRKLVSLAMHVAVDIRGAFFSAPCKMGSASFMCSSGMILWHTAYLTQPPSKPGI